MRRLSTPQYVAESCINQRPKAMPHSELSGSERKAAQKSSKRPHSLMPELMTQFWILLDPELESQFQD